MSAGLDLVSQLGKTDFVLRDFIKVFRRDPGLSRSVDKIFEIVVYALFSVLLESLEVKIGVKIENIENTILQEFADFTEKVLGLSKETLEVYQEPKVYRAGVAPVSEPGTMPMRHSSGRPRSARERSSSSWIRASGSLAR